MKKLIWLAALVAALCPFAKGQDAPKAQIFGGFSILNFDAGDSRKNAYGWQASVAGNVAPAWGIKGDIGGQYKKIAGVTLKAHEFLFGPQVNVPGDKASAFLHFLLGGAHFSGGGSSDNAFMLGIGGGVDIKAGPKAAIRILQFDWLPSRSHGDWSNKQIRLGFGIVANLGG